MYIFRLLRFKNLLIVMFTQYLLRYFALLPVLNAHAILPTLDSFHFFLLSLSTTLIAAGGYVINDIADQAIDSINKPNTRIVGRLISEKKALSIYHSINLLGFSIALYLAYYINDLKLITLFPFATLLLWLYSFYFKKMFLTGNIVVSLFCAFVAIIILFAERFVFYQLPTKDSFEILFLFLGYALFAYLSTMYRELIKDMEDMEGDRLNNCQTLPIMLGLGRTKVITFILGLTFLFFLAYFVFFLIKLHKYYDAAIITIAIIMPLLYSFMLLNKAVHKKDFHDLSNLTKWLMISGLLYLPIYQFLSK